MSFNKQKENSVNCMCQLWFGVSVNKNEETGFRMHWPNRVKHLCTNSFERGKHARVCRVGMLVFEM